MAVRPIQLPGEPRRDREPASSPEATDRDIVAGRKDIAEGNYYSNDEIKRWVRKLAARIEPDYD